MNKTLDEAFELIENMAAHHFQWSNERQIAPINPAVNQVSIDTSIAAQVDILNKQMASLL